MNIGLLIRGVKAGAKLAKSGAKATARGTKSAAKATARKAKSGARATAKAVGKNKVVRGASRVGGKVAEGVGYAATSGLKRGKTGRYFKGGGSKPIQSISKAKVRSTGKKVIGGAAAIGTGYGTTKTVKSKRAAQNQLSQKAPCVLEVQGKWQEEKDPCGENSTRDIATQRNSHLID